LIFRVSHQELEAANLSWLEVTQYALRDKQLSGSAYRLLCYMLTKPDDWVFRQKDLALALHTSLRSITRWKQELVEGGYLIMQKLKNQEGKHEWSYVIFPLPIGLYFNVVNQEESSSKIIYHEFTSKNLVHD